MVRLTTSLVPTYRSRLAARMIGLLLALAGAAWGASWAIGQPGSAEPISIRRVAVSPDRLPAELAKVKQGLMTPIPQAELEEKLSQAAKAQAAAKVKPHLSQASYAAELVGADLSWEPARGRFITRARCQQCFR